MARRGGPGSGVKREVDSGRKDSLGRRIRISVASARRALNNSLNRSNPAMDFLAKDSDSSTRTLYEDTAALLESREFEQQENTSFEQAMRNHRDHVGNWSDAADDVIEHGTPKEAIDLMTAMGESEEYLALLQTRELQNNLCEAYGNRLREAANAVEELTESDRQPSEEEIAAAADAFRQAQADLVEAEEETRSLNILADDYRNVMASLAKKVSEQRENTMGEYKGDTLGSHLVATAEYEDGTREWLEVRQQGLGASDIGVLLNDDRADAKYKQSNIDRIWASKLNPITDEEVEKNKAAHEAATDAISRGHFSEAFIADTYNTNHDDVNIVRSPKTFKHDGSPALINYDYLMSDPKTGEIIGNFEVKTSSSSDRWGDPDDGLDAIPKNYRIQALVQARTAGFPKGAVGVMINQNEMKTYAFDMTPELEAEADKYLAEATKIWGDIQKAKAEGLTARPKKARSTKGFDKNMLAPLVGKRGKPTKAGEAAAEKRKGLFKDVAALRGHHPRDYAKVEREFNLSMEGRDWHNPDHVADALGSLYRNTRYSDMSAIAVDVETGGYSSKTAPIISCGVAGGKVGDLQSTTTKEKLFGMTDRSLTAYRGTGLQNVHGIKPEDIAGKKTTSDPSSKQWFDQNISDSGARNVFMHNAAFDDSSLSSVPGYLEAKMRGDFRVQDTMKLAKFFSSSEKNTLRDAITSEGGTYVSGHKAGADAAMTLDYVGRLFNRIGDRTGQ